MGIPSGIGLALNDILIEGEIEYEGEAEGEAEAEADPEPLSERKEAEWL